MRKHFSRVCACIIDVLLPKSDRSIRTEKVSALTPNIRTVHIGKSVVTSLASYEVRAVKDAVGALKFEHSGAARALLAKLFDEYVMEEVWERSLEGAKRSFVVPIPLSTRRIAERGFNQVEEMLRATRAVRDGYVVLAPDVLTRIRDTRPQATLHRTERTQNVRDAFATPQNPTHPLKGAHLFLVDDVVTTGSTLTEAARALEEAGARVTCVALARA